MLTCFMSDLHGDFPEEILPCELVCICGDVSPLNIQGNHRKMRQWLRKVFKPWCEALPCRKVIFIAGNHDGAMHNLDFMYSIFSKDSKVTYLFHEFYTYTSLDGKDYKIFGTPYCKLFGNWAFMELDKTLEKLYSNIPENLDILLTHDQPFGYGDIILDDISWADGSHIGNKPLLKAILDKKPRIQTNGHLHSCQKGLIEIDQTKHYNVSLKNEAYRMVYKPTYINI